MKVLIQDGSEEGLVRKCDLKRTIERFKTDMCDREAWSKDSMKFCHRRDLGERF